ncbi:MAG: hypothetical protein D6826_08595 [Alphaproteobacteria bacterium]|nr:MAG: hypothetical protein D6826_08595 [Alphaproteobacteria bacterium]
MRFLTHPICRVLSSILVLLLAAPMPGAAATAASVADSTAETTLAPGRPSDVVARLDEALIDVMRNAEALGYRGRYARLESVLRKSFHFPLMAAISLGRHWRTLSPAQRRQFVAVFRRMSIATFAARFDGYGGERFEVVGEEPGPRGTVLVRNRLIKPDGTAIEINYLLKKTRDRWRVVDVYLDAKFSELALKRSEYGGILANEGFDALIARIERKLADLGADG